MKKFFTAMTLFWALSLFAGFTFSWWITGLILVLIGGALWFLFFFYPPLDMVEEEEIQSTDNN